MVPTTRLLIMASFLATSARAQTQPQTQAAPTVSQAAESATTTRSEAQVLAPGTQTSETTYEAEPINIMAQPPEEEFRDEFILPVQASLQLKASRNLIDRDTAKLNQIGDAIQQLMEKSTFDSTMAEVKLIKKAQKLYQKQLRKLIESQNRFREQFVEDNDKAHSSLEQGPELTTVDLDAND